MIDLTIMGNWVARAYEKPSKISDSGFVDASQAATFAELQQYLPSAAGDYNVIQRLQLDEQGEAYVFQEGFGSWDSAVLAVMGSLRLRLNTDESPMLVDENVNYDHASHPMGTAPGWIITRWEVRIPLVAPGDDFVCDFVTWEKDGNSVITRHFWKLY
jgi:hypothetical protein